MYKRAGWLIVCLLLCFFCERAYGQQDVDFSLTAHLLAGKQIIKVKRDFYDPYLWALAKNDEVYRINSLTLAIDDYTATFAVYNNLQFTDIAGHSKDTVFIATSSTQVIELKNGLLKTIGTPDGLTGTVNQIGVEYYVSNQAAFNLAIATTTNIYYYNCITEAIQFQPTTTPNSVYLFEASYRSFCFSNLGLSDLYDPSDQYPLTEQINFTTYFGAISYNNPEYGYHINTAYYVEPTVDFNNYYDDNSGGDYNHLTQVWGTENGLFQNTYFQSLDGSSVNAHYLKGLNVNKVTSIYGLKVFPGLIKENLLVGTNNGLYFSNSGYDNYVGYLNNYNTFTLESDIGNQPVNDISVDANSYLQPANSSSTSYNYYLNLSTICEGGAWVATNNGLYLIKPDYKSYLKSDLINAIYFQNQPASTSTLDICASDSAVAVIDTTYYTGLNIQWYKNGAPLSAETADTLHIKSTGSYFAVLSDPCDNISFVTNNLQVNIITGPTFTFNYPDVIGLCNNSTDTLKVTYNTSYHYRWYTNGTLNGDTTSSFIVTSPGTYYVEVSACINSWVPSKTVMVNISDPVLNINDTTICMYTRQSVVLTAPPGYSKYLWNNQFTGQTFTVTTAQTVVLTVTTANGCQASQQIHVFDQCPNLEIPNTFTPNGDGKNDTWIIEGLNNDLSASLKVFNRYGTQVYKSDGILTPWNGEYNGHVVPAGIYYYVLTIKNGKQTFSGWVTVLH